MTTSSTGTIHTPKQVADRRAQTARTSPSTSMFGRMLFRAAVLRRGRAASALLAMIVAAAVTTAMMSLYVDTQAKLRTEFRSYGANVVIVAKDVTRDGQSLPADALAKRNDLIENHPYDDPQAHCAPGTGAAIAWVHSRASFRAPVPDMWQPS